ncbi:MAG TPA: SDR family oxidoreductase [Methanomicrobiales archaeon]|jgi:short-subunit dehydrogenase|nr:SDR family oxidoreductase [Methanomicrobiales archaeon]
METDQTKLSGRVAIVTGASSGIGRATARLLAGHGVKVALVSRSREKLEALSRELPGSLAVPADMTRIPEVKRMVDRTRRHFGRIDILINNAGQGYDAPVELIDIGTLRYIHDLTVIGPIVAMQQVIPTMRAQGGGTILNISSGTALMDLPGMSPYASAKKALAGISLAARQELEKDDIVVSVAFPYITLTDFERKTIRAIPVPEDQIEPAGPYPSDSAEFVAEKLVEGILSGEAEIYSHEWQKGMGREE